MTKPIKLPERNCNMEHRSTAAGALGAILTASPALRSGPQCEFAENFELTRGAGTRPFGNFIDAATAAHAQLPLIQPAGADAGGRHRGARRRCV